MKKLSPKRRAQLERVRLRRFQWRCRFARRKKFGDHTFSVLGTDRSPWRRVHYRNEYGHGAVLAKDRTPAPAHLCLDENYEETADFLNRIREKLVTGVMEGLEKNLRPANRPLRIDGYYDFTTLKKCSPSAALILASEYDRARSVMGDWSIPMIEMNRWDPGVLATLDDVGFFRLLEVGRPRKRARGQPGAAETLEFKTGSVVGQEAANDLILTLAAMVFPDAEEIKEEVLLSRMRMFGALVEATENTCHHAYKGMDTPLVQKRWWMTGTVDRVKRHISIAVFDQGLSIPSTLPTWEQNEWIEGRIERSFGLWA